jgi:hypothetical protein
LQGVTGSRATPCKGVPPGRRAAGAYAGH